MRKLGTVNTSISRHSNDSLMLGILYSVLFLVAGELEFTTQVGLSLSPVSLAGQGRCQKEKPEEEHLADWGESSLTAGTLEAGLPSLFHHRQGKAALGWKRRACSGSRESQGSFHIIPSKTFS